MNQNNKFIDILLMIIISFFAAFTIGLNKYAISLEKGKTPSKLLTVSEILVHGISGFLIGLIFTKFISDPYILCAISGIGGMIGQKLLYTVAKNFIISIMKLDSEQTDEIKNDLKYEEPKDGFGIVNNNQNNYNRKEDDGNKKEETSNDKKDPKDYF